MFENALDKIIKKKEQRLKDLKKSVSVDDLQKKISENKSFINFKEKVEYNVANNKDYIIEKIKKKNHNDGLIIKDYNPIDIAKKYNENKATCLSVLTEEDFF